MRGGLLVASAAAVALLNGCGGCNEQHPSPPKAAAPTASVVAAAPGPTETPPDHYIIIFGDGDPDTGPAPLTVKFSVFDPLKNIEGPKYVWDFGDGSPPAKKRSPTHVYERPGKYTAHLTVTDATGVTDDDTVDIDVREPAAAKQ